MKHPTYDEETVRTGLRLPITLHKRLKAEAEARVVSVNLLVNAAIEHYLDHLADPIEALRATSSYERPSPFWRRFRELTERTFGL